MHGSLQQRCRWPLRRALEGIRAHAHGFKDRLVSPAVILDRARYLCPPAASCVPPHTPSVRVVGCSFHFHFGSKMPRFGANPTYCPVIIEMMCWLQTIEETCGPRFWVFPPRAAGKMLVVFMFGDFRVGSSSLLRLIQIRCLA